MTLHVNLLLNPKLRRVTAGEGVTKESEKEWS